jgi:hypothetical protein
MTLRRADRCQRSGRGPPLSLHEGQARREAPDRETRLEIALLQLLGRGTEGTRLHRPDTHGHITLPGDEDDGELAARADQASCNSKYLRLCSNHGPGCRAARSMRGGGRTQRAWESRGPAGAPSPSAKKDGEGERLPRTSCCSTWWHCVHFRLGSVGYV